jgi:molybdate transport repressor ModE-like protein
MELRQLRYLRAIAAHGSMTAAAREVGVGQSTLSESMRKLEEELDARLLHRNARGVTLTRAGELVAAHAATILTHADQLPAAVAALTEGLSGTFRLACYHSLGAWLLPSVMARLLVELPER